MAVAVKTTPEASARQAASRLAVGSLVGALYVLGSLAVVFYAIPALWQPASAVETSLQMLVMLAASVGLIFVGAKMIGDSPPAGIRAGMAAGVLGILACVLLTRLFGGWLEAIIKDNSSTTGLILTAAIFAGLSFALITLFFREGTERALVATEEAGWLSFNSYKRTQGQRVRRGTIMGVLVLVGTGIYTMLSHQTVENYGAASSMVRVPFTGGQWYITLLPHLQFTLPILLTAFGLWFGYRLVNFPPFADFLIATEAEMNKVSWTTKKKLVQDTIVVLTTMILITIFLFLVDGLWSWVLSNPYVGVLRTGEGAAIQKNLEQDW